MDFVETIRDTIERHGLIPKGTRVVAAVSGGADSVALLHVLRRLGYSLSIAHLNHQLRGTASDADEAFVVELAENLEVPIMRRSVDVCALASKEGLSLEMAARQARHDFFSTFDSAAIALAHHADDQVETFLLRLARGAGSEGLSGMAYRQELSAIRLIRPMLDLPKDAISSWLTANGYSWRTDESNTDESFLRNRVRHTLLPMLERELNPNIRENIRKTMTILRDENSWMDELQADSDAAAARRRRLRKWLFEHGAREAGFDTVERILALEDKGCGSAVVELNSRQRVVVEYGRSRFEEGSAESFQPAWTLSVRKGTGWRKDSAKRVGELPAEASFSAEKAGASPLTVRGVRPGDRMEPLGMEGSRKLQDILTDLKIPRALRSHLPVVLCRNEIIWLPGYRIARDWAVRGDEKSIHVRIEQSGAA